MTDLYEEQVRMQVHELVTRIKSVENEDMRNGLATFAVESFSTIQSGDSFGSTTTPATPVATVMYKPSDPIVPPGGGNPMEHIDESLRPIVPTSPPSPVVAQPAQISEQPLEAPKSSAPPEQSGGVLSQEDVAKEQAKASAQAQPKAVKAVPMVEQSKAGEATTIPTKK